MPRFCKCFRNAFLWSCWWSWRIFSFN